MFCDIELWQLAVVWLLETTGSDHCLRDKLKKKVSVKVKVGMKGPTERYSAEDVAFPTAQQSKGTGSGVVKSCSSPPEKDVSVAL